MKYEGAGFRDGGRGSQDLRVVAREILDEERVVEGIPCERNDLDKGSTLGPFVQGAPQKDVRGVEVRTIEGDARCA